MTKMADPDPIVAASSTLTQEQFDGLLRKLHVDRNQAALKYEELRWKLVKFFQWSYCSSAENLADETLDRVARKLQTGDQEILDVEAYTWGVARKIRQEGKKKDIRSVPLSDAPDASLASDATIHAIHGKLQKQRELSCLHGCLERLPATEMELFLAYRVDKAHYAETRKKLATKFGLTSGALRIRIIRLRERLEKCLAKCLGS